MINLFVNIDNKEVATLLKELPITIRQKAPQVVAEAGAELTRVHIDGISRARHRSRSPRDFYQAAANSVIQQVVSDGAEISIPHIGFALRYHGGTVRPSGRISLITGRPIRRLAIPLSGSPAEGKTPGDFDNVFVVKGKKKGTAFLAGKKGRGLIRLLFALVEKTEHKADHSILPTEAEYQTAAEKAIQTLINEVNR